MEWISNINCFDRTSFTEMHSGLFVCCMFKCVQHFNFIELTGLKGAMPDFQRYASAVHNKSQ